MKKTTTSEITDCAIFFADFVDDSVWTSDGMDGDLVVPGGKEIASYFVKYLGEVGIKANPPFQHSYYAWLIEVEEGKAIVSCYLQDIGPWLLMSEAKGSLFGGREAKEKLHRRVIAALMEV